MAVRRRAVWWVDRWRKSTAYTDMTLTEQGAYRNLLDELWLRGGVLPKDDRILGRICGDPTEWRRVRKAVLAHFTLTRDGYRNETHDAIAAAVHAAHLRQQSKGRARAAKGRRGPGSAASPVARRQ